LHTVTQALSPQDLSALIGSIYDCALDPARWEQTLSDIKNALGFETAMLHLSDLRHDRMLINRVVGIDAYWQERQREYLPEIHARLAQDLATWKSFDDPHVMSRHIPRQFLESSGYFQNCLKPNGIVDIMQYFLIYTPTRMAGFGLGRHERNGEVTDREIELGALLLPHVRRAVTISDVLDARTIERERMAKALDALRCAVVLTDASSVILHANDSAQTLLRKSELIQATGGVLQAKAAAAASELRSAIALAAQDEATIGKTGLAICLTELETFPVYAHVLPLTGSELRTRLQPAAVAAVFIGAPPDEQDGADAMAAAFELTRAETRVLANLLAGRTLVESAATLRIAASTEKTHLDSIFSKTGVSRQADLVRLGTGFVPPTKSDR
jgi:DNA-binding CsgD family transcriptional regulator/PAS domain-containing protein